MRKFLIVAAVLAATGCSAAVPAPQASEQAREMAPQHGGVFQTMGIRALLHLNPWTQDAAANASFYLNGGVYDQLLDYDYKADEDYRFSGKIGGELAESWDQPDRQTYVFHIRRGVKWHDGQPLTAADVKWSFEYVADPANKMLGVSDLRAITTIAMPDDYTVVIKIKDPDVDFLKKLASQARVSILAKHVFESGQNLEKVGIGTGPFKVESFTPNGQVVYADNKDYWKPGLPYLDKWRMLAPADEAARTAAFFAGQNDVLKVEARPQAEAILAQNKEIKLSTFVQENDVALNLKLTRPPFNDLKVRQAISLALDRRAMVSTLTGSDGLMNPPGMSPIYQTWALPPAELEAAPGWKTPKEPDLARAKQLLAEAGYSNGLSFTVNMDRNRYKVVGAGEMIAAQLSPIGVDVKLQPMDTAVYGKALADGEYQSVVDTGNSLATWPLQLHSKGKANTTGLNDPELDALIETQAQEFDEAKRAETIRQAQRLLLSKVYMVPLITYPGYLLTQPWVNNFVDNRGGNVSNPDWSQAWLDLSKLPAR